MLWLRAVRGSISRSRRRARRSRVLIGDSLTSGKRPYRWPYFGLEQLEQAVGTFGGTLILVTHDRRLLEGIGITRRAQVTDGEVHEVPEVAHGA